MKKFLALSAAVALVATLQANMIEWSLPALTDGSDQAVSYTLDDIVFIPTATPTSYDDATGKISGTASGSNTLIDSDDDYVAATWTDSVTTPTEYYMAYKGSDGVFYALNDGAGDPVTITTTASDPLNPGSAANGSVFLADSSNTVKTVAPAVPEPATAVLALAGIAMLIRRRKA